MVGGRRREGRDSEKGGWEEGGEGREGETNRVRRKGRRRVREREQMETHR